MQLHELTGQAAPAVQQRHGLDRPDTRSAAKQQTARRVEVAVDGAADPSARVHRVDPRRIGPAVPFVPVVPLRRPLRVPLQVLGVDLREPVRDPPRGESDLGVHTNGVHHEQPRWIPVAQRTRAQVLVQPSQ